MLRFLFGGFFGTVAGGFLGFLFGGFLEWFDSSKRVE
jgi:hypothetical protein